MCPRSLATLALRSTGTKVQLPVTSVIEEFKCCKARLHLMLRNSSDTVVRNTQPGAYTGRKWDVSKVIQEVEEALKFSEVMGDVQQGRCGIGWQKNRWWSVESERGSRSLEIEEIRHEEERMRVTQAMRQSQQGA